MSIQLGRTYRDKITGFEGVATGHVQYMTGCNQVLLQPCAREGKWLDSVWLDEQRLEVCGENLITLDNGASPGFDKAAPLR